MQILKKGLLRVPLFCVLAGYVSFSLIVHVFARFAVVTNPDGSTVTDQGRVLLIHGVVFGLTLLVGRLFFRRMKRREIAQSATFLVVALLAVTLSQLREGGSGMLGISFYLSIVSEWCRFVSQLASRITGNAWMGAFLEALMPYIFTVFGQKTDPVPDEEDIPLYLRTGGKSDPGAGQA